MKNNIKKAPVKFREDLLYSQHFMLILSLPQISDYHHLNVVSLNSFLRGGGGPTVGRNGASDNFYWLYFFLSVL